MRLRTVLTLVMSGVGAIAIGVALALVVLTSSLYHAGLRLADTTERVRLLMELESYALQQALGGASGDHRQVADTIDRLHATSAPALSADIERLEDMLLSLSQASTPIERQARLDTLVPELRRVVAREDESARRAMADAASWNTVADITGIGAIVVLLVGVTAALAWLWRGALQPLVRMAETIGRFARGDRRARVSEDGPREIRELAGAFNEMTVALGQQREQQLAFIGGVAHDLRTPLNALQVAVTLLDQPSTDPMRVRDRIRRQIARMDHMIGDLLDRTRIETGRFELTCHDNDFRELLTRVVDQQRDSAPSRLIHVVLPHQPVVVTCDPVRMEQVIANLLGNAIKYSPESSDVEVALACDGTDAVLSVTDHGIGMTAADRESVFEPFRRGGNVGNIGGTGLGLSVTRKIVEAHGGTIDAHSELGLGSVFVVRLPLAHQAEGQPRYCLAG